jgi:hypothetical protein
MQRAAEFLHVKLDDLSDLPRKRKNKNANASNQVHKSEEP